MTCIVVRLENLREHPTRTNLQLATVAGKEIVVGRHYDEGVLGIFIPDGAIIPDRLAEEMWLKGKLAGKNKNRVKRTERYGIVSEGLFYGSRFWTLCGNEKVYQDGPSWNPSWVEGQDVTKEIGVTFAKVHPSPIKGEKNCMQCGRTHGMGAYCSCGSCLYVTGTQKGIPRDILENYPLIKCSQCGKESFWD